MKDGKTFPLDDGTLSVIRESLDRTVIGFDDDRQPIYRGASFGLHHVLDFLSGYYPSLLVQAVNEYDQPIPDVYDYEGGWVYSEADLIRALIDEIQQLRENGS